MITFPRGAVRDGRALRRATPVAAALALALAFGAGEAAAQQTWCEGTAVTGRTAVIVCDRGAGDPNPANVHIIVHNPNIAATNYNESPIVSDVYTNTDVTIEVTGGSLSAAGQWAKGIRAWHPGASGDVAVTLQNVDIMTSNLQGGAVFTFQQGTAGNIRIDVSGGSITTTGTPTSQGIYGRSTGSGNIVIDARNVAIKTNGNNANGVIGYSTGTTWDVDIDFVGGSVVTNGIFAHGVYGGGVGGTGQVDVRVEDASVTTRGQFASAVTGGHGSEGDVKVRVLGSAVVTAEGESGIGVYAVHGDDGSSETTIGAGARIRAPFGNGVHGRMLSTADGAGRIVIASEGATEARDAGILAWAEPRSGSTFGDGEAATGALRTAPMIHVVSSGDVTTGEGVMDAWIRAAVAGDDETLSAGEKAVLDAIEAGDEMALETALNALPADYTDDWKTRMKAFRIAHGAKRTDRHRRPWQQYGDSGRGASRFLPTDAAREAAAAAFEILDIPRAVGIRAMALSHVEIADHVRNGDVDSAITAIAEASRTTQQKATLAAQRMLSAAERTVLEAVLTGGALETALAALPAAYTAAWKDGVRQRALAYNDGDIRVDVTGGTITAEGDGVHARYVLTHDRNGAIAVSVAAGATVSAERHGVHVGGAGLSAENDDLRDQTVTVNGAVMGGTGAGVHLAGGGTVTVGKTGRIGASSGMGILSDGAGDLVATVHGAVEGDVRNMGGGALTLSVPEGGRVTGTVHDAGPMTVAGRIGRLLYGNGGAVTVAATGRITGVEGDANAIHSAAGDLSVTVAGAVGGDVRATGGDLTFASLAGSSVTGTVHDPAGPLTVHGSIGRLLYGNGGTVTVADTGRITGVEGEADAIRSAAGDLSVTVAGMVSGDVRALGDGDLSATVTGRVDGDVRATGGDLTFASLAGSSVTGTVHDPAGPLTVHGSIGRLLYSNGGAVTVAAMGRLTGIDGEAIRSAAGDLSVTVAGMVTGDVHGTGDGDLSAVVTGAIVGDLRNTGDGDLTATIAGAVMGDVRSTGDGDLMATITGRVSGDVEGLGAGEHVVAVAEGGVVTGTIRLAASTVTVDGAAGRIVLDRGGMVTLGGAGRLTGVDGVGIRSAAGDLTLTVAGMVAGDLRALGDGDLTARVTGRVDGDVEGLDAGAHRVVVAPGGTVTGTIRLAAGAAMVDGAAGRVVLGRGGAVTVGEDGGITGVAGDPDAIRSEQGELVVTIRLAAGETPTDAVGPEGRIGGRIVEQGGAPQLLIQAPGDAQPRPVGPSGTAATVPDGARDLGLMRDGPGFRAVSDYAPRSRVYEALPSVLLGLNDLPTHRDRLAALRSPNGAWARVDAEGGERRAKRSTSTSGAGIAYDHRRYGVRTGFDAPFGTSGMAGVSAHYRRGSAELSGNDGEIEASGAGFGVSGAWQFTNGVYLDGQISATWYEAEMKSGSRGLLKSDARGFGHALGLEAGRRIALGKGRVTLTPRARLVRSQLRLKEFTDAHGSRVSLEKGRSVTGRAGLRVETAAPSFGRARWFASLDVEREFTAETRMRVSSAGLSSERDATRARLALGGSQEWNEGRYAMQGAANYAAGRRGNRNYGAALSLKLRF